MAIDYRKMPLSGKSLRHALKAKSRHRREEQAALAAASPASRPIRNDLVPKLALIERAPADLVRPGAQCAQDRGSPSSRGRHRDQQFGVLRSGSDRRAKRRARWRGPRRGGQASGPPPHTLHPRRSSYRLGTPTGADGPESPERERAAGISTSLSSNWRNLSWRMPRSRSPASPCPRSIRLS